MPALTTHRMLEPAAPVALVADPGSVPNKAAAAAVAGEQVGVANGAGAGSCRDGKVHEAAGALEELEEDVFQEHVERVLGALRRAVQVSPQACGAGGRPQASCAGKPSGVRSWGPPSGKRCR